MIKRKALCTFLFLSFTCCIQGFAQTGLLDPTFNDDGIFVDDISLPDEQAMAILVEPNGKILVAGNYQFNGPILLRLNGDGTLNTEFEPLSGYFNALALQSNGKVVAAGGGQVARYNSNGIIDSTFGVDGSVNAYFQEAYHVLIQPDDKIVVTGYQGYTYQSLENFAIARFHSNGHPDHSFMNTGTVETDFNEFTDIAYSAALQPDGKIIAAGATVVAGDYNFAVVRYNADGSLDNSFSADGKLSFSIDTLSNGCYATAMQNDGKILLAGYTTIESYINTDVAVVRLNEDGSFDTSFANDGILIIPMGPGNDVARSISILSDGKILIGGDTQTGNGYDMMVIRCNPDGSSDSSFNSTGIAFIDYESHDDFGYGIAINSVNDKIVVCGAATIGVQTDLAVASLEPDGSVDNGFGFDGEVSFDFGNASNVCYNIAVQSDGKIILAGETINGGLDAAVMRLNQDGSRDSTFNENGLVIFSDPYNYSEYFRPLVLQTDGKLVVGGELDFNFWSMFRLNPDGSTDSSFNEDGKVITEFSGTLTSLALQADGKIVAAGYCYSPVYGDNEDWAVARYNVDGTLDSTFGGDGIVTFDYEHDSQWAYDVLVQPDGKIVVAGELDQSTGIIRLNPDGSFDNAFSNDGIMLATPNSNFNYYTRSILIQADGKIVFSLGTTLGRTNSNGTLDTTFGGGWGYQSVIIPGYVYAGSETIPTDQFLIQPDGKFLLAATVWDGDQFGQNDFAFIRFTKDGPVDSTWGVNGVMIYDIDSSTDFISSIAMQPDGKVIGCGATDKNFMAVRILTDINVGIANAESDGEMVADLYPNPFSTYTSIQFSLEKNSKVIIDLYDLRGRKIKSFADENFSAGTHELSFDRGQVSSGLYLVMLKFEQSILMKRLVIQ